jgi:exopolyphosphatase / guanosine-5'-triphosphate,3'-diphosphate pyrophosphatase
MGQYIGLIDLGSNTARLVVYEIDGQGLMVEHDNMKRTLRLISYLQKDGRISESGIQKTLACMAQFKEFCNVRKITEIIGVATAAVRQAVNGNELLQQIHDLTGIQFRLLSGEQEAYYGYLAIINSMNIENAVTVDIGGGSTEITRIQNRTRIESISLPFGVVTLTQHFLKESPTSPIESERLELFLKQQFAKVPWINDCKVPLVAMGGTARTVAKISQKQKQYSLTSFHHYVMQPSEIEYMYQWIGGLPLGARKEIPGLSKDRADVIVAGIAVFQYLLKTIQSPKFITSNKGLRDGILFERMLQAKGVTSVQDVAMFSAEQFLKRYKVDVRHAMHVRSLSTQLFDECKKLKLLSYGKKERRILELSAMLYDIGRSINVFEKEAHTFYLLTNVLLMGLTQQERLLVAMVASYKNQKRLQKQLAEHADIVSKSDKTLIELLGHIVIIARALDRSKTQQILSVTCREKKDQLVISCVTQNEDAMEFQFLQEALDKFAKTIKKPVKYDIHYQNVTHS